MEKSSGKETFGGATFVVLPEKVNIEVLISRRIQNLQKIPKLSPLIEKSEKFQDFFKKLCAFSNNNQINTGQTLSP